MKRPAILAAIGITILFCLLRNVSLYDMEYKDDQIYTYERVSAILEGRESLPALGMPSGVFIRNPGMSVWVFVFAGALFGASDPVALCRSVVILNCIAFVLFLAFVFREIAPHERTIWLWALALVAVNPVLVWVHRIIWAQSILPIFSFLFFYFWWKRDRVWAAVGWGVTGLVMGQIHMSGFFFHLAFFVWTLVFDLRKLKRSTWIGFFVGCGIGFVPMIPWIEYLIESGFNPKGGWDSTYFLRFPVFWFTEPFGFHVGNPLGLYKGAILAQNADFARYPLLGGGATYLVGAAHFLLLGIAFWFWGVGIRAVFRRRKEIFSAKYLTGSGSPTMNAHNACLLGYGVLMMFSGLLVRRYYLMITLPFEWIYLAWVAIKHMRRPNLVLGIVFVLELLISVEFLHYVHQNEGSRAGDYGIGYQYQEIGPDGRRVTR